MSRGTHFGEKLWGQGAQDGELKEVEGITKIFRYLKYSTNLTGGKLRVYAVLGVCLVFFSSFTEWSITKGTDPDSVEWAGA